MDPDLSLAAFRQLEGAPVPALALPRQLARAAVRGGVEWAFYRPVVRQAQFAPCGVVERRVFRHRRRPEVEAPIVAEDLGISGFEFAKRLAKEGRVLGYPGTAFTHDNSGAAYIRFAYTKSTGELKMAVERIEGIVKSL